MYNNLAKILSMNTGRLGKHPFWVHVFLGCMQASWNMSAQ